MEAEQKEVVRSTFYLQDIVDIFEYGSATFGERAGMIFYEDLKMTVRSLETQYLLHPECRYLKIKSKIYRNIIIGSYLIIYIALNRVEVLRAFHGSRSPKTIKSSRKIKP
ncbi:type II toxin-antitoxin system RelE/ParE family toxin [Flavobacterium sp. SM2513]|uniref:type II toxin-antitoxin system RelE/ParE family toxin n=1 Tax=Flavobacterium sp. SM2513 TaxID=3424766 RepID=UPI003D7FF280